MADPVAEKSTFLCMYMSSHPDTLVAYVKYFGKVSEPVASARMTSIDSRVRYLFYLIQGTLNRLRILFVMLPQGMTLKYKVKGKGEAEFEVRVSFDPLLAGYEEVKPRLLGMTADAQEALGMVRLTRPLRFSLLIDWTFAGCCSQKRHK